MRYFWWNILGRFLCDLKIQQWPPIRKAANKIRILFVDLSTTKWHHKFFDLNDGLFAAARRKHPDAIRCLRDKTGIVGLLDPSNFLQQPSPFKHLHGVILEFFEENKAASDADVRDMFLSTFFIELRQNIFETMFNMSLRHKNQRKSTVYFRTIAINKFNLVFWAMFHDFTIVSSYIK